MPDPLASPGLSSPPTAPEPPPIAGSDLPEAIDAEPEVDSLGTDPVESVPDNAPADLEEMFRTDHLQSDLKGRSVRGGMYTMGAQGVKFGINLVSTMALARLLSPTEFGLVAMVSPITGFIGLFKDMGLSMATVQRDKVNHGQVSTLFWINVSVSLGLMLVAMAISPAVGWFYHDWRTMWLTLALSGTFIFGGLTAQHQALLARQMKFGRLAAIDVLSMGSGVAAAIFTAWIGWSFWSLVVMFGANGLTNCILIWILSPWRPGRPVRGSGVRSMLRFGTGMTVVNVVAFFNVNIDRVILGKIGGDWQLGIYSRSNGLFIGQLSQVITPLGNVLLPAMCRMADDEQRLRRAAKTAMELTLALSLPLGAVCLFASDWVVLGLLGHNWAAAIPVTKAVSILTFWFAPGAVIQWLLVAKGRSGILALWELAWFAVVVIVSLLGAYHGAVGVALGLALANLAVAPIYVLIGQRYTPLKAVDVLHVFAPNIINLAAAFGCIWAIKRLVAPEHALLGLVLSVLTVSAVHLAILTQRGVFHRTVALMRPQRSPPV